MALAQHCKSCSQGSPAMDGGELMSLRLPSPSPLKLSSLLPSPCCSCPTWTKGFQSAKQAAGLTANRHHTKPTPQRRDCNSPFSFLTSHSSPPTPCHTSNSHSGRCKSCKKSMGGLTHFSKLASNYSYCPSSRSLASTLPMAPSRTPWRRSAARAFATYSACSWPALKSTALLRVDDRNFRSGLEASENSRSSLQA